MDKLLCCLQNASLPKKFENFAAETSEDLVNFTTYIGFLSNICILRFEFGGPSDDFSAIYNFFVQENSG